MLRGKGSHKVKNVEVQHVVGPTITIGDFFNALGQ